MLNLNFSYSCTFCKFQYIILEPLRLFNIRLYFLTIRFSLPYLIEFVLNLLSIVYKMISKLVSSQLLTLEFRIHQ
jgi:hypothetical protein